MMCNVLNNAVCVQDERLARFVVSSHIKHHQRASPDDTELPVGICLRLFLHLLSYCVLCSVAAVYPQGCGAHSTRVIEEVHHLL